MASKSTHDEKTGAHKGYLAWRGGNLQELSATSCTVSDVCVDQTCSLHPQLQHLPKLVGICPLSKGSLLFRMHKSLASGCEGVIMEVCWEVSLGPATIAVLLWLTLAGPCHLEHFPLEQAPLCEAEVLGQGLWTPLEPFGCMTPREQRDWFVDVLTFCCQHLLG